MAKNAKDTGMRRLLELVEYESKRTGKDVAEQDFKVTDVQYSRRKNTDNQILGLLCHWHKTYKIPWDRIGEAIEHDYGKKKD